jgi:hypothetical protein
MIERISEDEYIDKIEASAEWATKENYGDWVLFVRDEPNGPVSKFMGPDPRKKTTIEWLAFGIRIYEATSEKWLPENFDVRSELPEGDLE